MNTVQRIVAVILYVSVLIGLLFLRFNATRIDDQPFVQLYEFFIGLWIAIGALIFQSVRDWLRQLGERLFVSRAPKLRMLVYGLGRSGKSTIVDRFLTVDDQTVEQHRKISTPEFTIEEAEIILRKSKKKYPIAIADYKGQTPDEIVVDAPEEFFGAKGNRKVNVLIFVVDLFPEPRDSSGNLIDDIQMLRAYKNGSEQKLRKQVEENRLYVNKFSIQPVFSVCHNSENMIAVRVLINKADLLKELIDKNFLPNNTSVHDYALSLYSETIDSISKACEDYQIADFSVHVISAGSGLFYDKQSKARSIDFIFGAILKAYASKVDKR